MMERFDVVYANLYTQLGKLNAAQARLVEKGLNFATDDTEYTQVLTSFDQINDILIQLYDELIRIKRQYCGCCWR